MYTNRAQEYPTDPADPKIGSLAKSWISLHPVPRWTRARLLQQAVAPPERLPRKRLLLRTLEGIFQLHSQDPGSMAISETLLLTKTRLFGLPESRLPCTRT